MNPLRTKNTMLKNSILAAPTLQETLSRTEIINTLTKESYSNENSLIADARSQKQNTLCSTTMTEPEISNQELLAQEHL